MHPIFLAVVLYAVAALLGLAVLAVRNLRVPRSPIRLQPWLDLDGSARRQQRRTVSLR